MWKAVDEENAKLEGRGRVLVRPSGTEPLVRVMVEAPDEAECEAICERLVELVAQLGAGAAALVMQGLATTLYASYVRHRRICR